MSVKARRGPVRTALIRAIDELKAEVNGDKDKDRVQLLWKKIQRHSEKLFELDDKMAEELQNADTTEEQYQAEYEEVSGYLDKYEEAVQLVERFLKTVPEVVNVGAPAKKSEGYFLPRLELKKFGGDPKDWIAFWSQYKSIHENDDISTEEKFQYLIQATIPKSTARSVVDSFPPSAENYPKVMEYLESRFGREEILVEVYVRELLGLVIHNIQKRGAFTVSSIYDKLETQLRSLESLGVTSDKYAAMLYPLVESSLPEDVLRAWERSRIHLTKNGDTELSCLLKFIRSEVESEERILIAKTGFGSQEGKISKQKNQDIPTSTDLYTGEDEQHKENQLCIFCDKKHDSTSCYQAPKMSMEEKQKKIKEKKACFMCLKKNHVSKFCKSKVKCQLCDRRHHVIMCPGLGNHRGEAATDAEAKEKDKVSSSLANRTLDTVILQTLVVRVCNKGKERIVRVLIDMGSQLSYVTTKLAKVLDLEKLDEVTLGHGLFGGQEIKNVNHRIFKVDTGSWENETKQGEPVKLHVLDQEKICGKVTRVPPGPWLEELQAQGITISDAGYDKPDIHILIGADVAGSLLTGKIVRTSSGPVAIETKLGWVMMGKCTSDLHEYVGSYHSTSIDVSIQNLWKLEVLGIRDPIEVNEEGRYEVGMPFKSSHLPLSDNFQSAKKRLSSVLKKLDANGQTEIYRNIF